MAVLILFVWATVAGAVAVAVLFVVAFVGEVVRPRESRRVVERVAAGGTVRSAVRQEASNGQ